MRYGIHHETLSPAKCDKLLLHHESRQNRLLLGRRCIDYCCSQEYRRSPRISHRALTREDLNRGLLPPCRFLRRWLESNGREIRVVVVRSKFDQSSSALVVRRRHFGSEYGIYSTLQDSWYLELSKLSFRVRKKRRFGGSERDRHYHSIFIIEKERINQKSTESHTFH